MRFKLLSVVLSFLILCLPISSSYASNLVATSTDKLRVFEILTMLENEGFQPFSPFMGRVPTQEVIDAWEEGNPKIREIRLMMFELNGLMKKDYPLEFWISLTKKNRIIGLDLNPIIVRIINEETSYTDELMFEFLDENAKLTDPRDKGTGSDCLTYGNYCYTVIETFIKRGNVPQYIEHFMLNNNYMNERHLGKVNSQMDYSIIENKITELLFLASENDNYILNNKLESLAANRFLRKLYTTIKHNPKIPNLGYSPYPKWYKDVDTAIVDLRLIQAALQEY